MAHFLYDLAKRKCLTVSPDTPIERVVSTLSSNSIGALVVQTKPGRYARVDNRLLSMEEGGSSFGPQKDTVGSPVISIRTAILWHQIEVNKLTQTTNPRNLI